MPEPVFHALTLAGGWDTDGSTGYPTPTGHFGYTVHNGRCTLEGRLFYLGDGFAPSSVLDGAIAVEHRPSSPVTFQVFSDGVIITDTPLLGYRWNVTVGTDGSITVNGHDGPFAGSTPHAEVEHALMLSGYWWPIALHTGPAAWDDHSALITPEYDGTIEVAPHNGWLHWRGDLTAVASLSTDDVIAAPPGLPADARPASVIGSSRVPFPGLANDGVHYSLSTYEDGRVEVNRGAPDTAIYRALSDGSDYLGSLGAAAGAPWSLQLSADAATGDDDVTVASHWSAAWNFRATPGAPVGSKYGVCMGTPGNRWLIYIEYLPTGGSAPIVLRVESPGGAVVRVFFFNESFVGGEITANVLIVIGSGFLKSFVRNQVTPDTFTDIGAPVLGSVGLADYTPLSAASYVSVRSLRAENVYNNGNFGWPVGGTFLDLDPTADHDMGYPVAYDIPAGEVTLTPGAGGIRRRKRVVGSGRARS